MTTSKLLLSLKFIGVLTLMVICTLPANAQFLRTSYFMEGTHYRQQLNPALMPTKGYFNLPVVGALNVTANSTSLGYQDIIDIIDNGNDFYKSSDFMGRLKDNNNLNVNFNTEILSAGWYKGQNFWTVNVGLRMDIGAKITKSMFSFLNEVDELENNWNNNEYNIGGQQLNINAFTEIGVGYARALNNRLTVGGKVKALLGIGNMELKINNAYMKANLPTEARLQQFKEMQITDMGQVNALKSEISKYAADLNVSATLESSFKGLNLKKEEGQDYISEFEFESKDMGIAGYGFGIDLGASYKLMDNLTVSASILDLGFISWSKGSTKYATAGNRIELDGKTYVDELSKATTIAEAQAIVNNFSNLSTDYLDRVGGGDVLNYDMLQLTENNEGKSRKSSLASTLVFGAEYGLFNNKLAFGVLSTTRFVQPKSLTELTLSANYRPKSWFNVALSYSAIQSAGKSFGLGLKLGPVFVGTDYMFLGKNSKSVNGFVGISVPLGGKKVEKQG